MRTAPDEPEPGDPARARLVRDSWRRASHLDPGRVHAEVELGGEELRDVRAHHPLAGAVPVVRSLLVEHALDTAVVVALGDARGRLLWVEGDPALRAEAERMAFVEGAGWAEDRVGTSAPGTALAVDAGVQIRGREHFAEAVKRWSCTAVPVHDPRTRELIGVLDITGGEEVAAPGVLALLDATVAAMERELLIQSLTAGPEGAARPRRRRSATRASAVPPRLHVLGRDQALLEVAGHAPLELSARHAEILTLLAWHPEGLTAERLAELVYGRADAVVTLRAEMVRLKRRLTGVADAVVPTARPYRLPHPLELDAQGVLSLLDRGAHRAALEAGAAEALPGSAAPGVEDIRAELAARIRESVLESASLETVLAFTAHGPGAEDPEALRLALALLPRRSPKRAGVVARLQQLE